MLTALIIVTVMGTAFIASGIYGMLYAKKPLHFWSNSDMFEVKDIKGYNRAVGKLFIAYGVILMLLFLPILCWSEIGVIITIIGTAFEDIGVMVVYSLVIEHKYRK